MRLTFRLTLLAALVGLVLATAAVIGWIGYRHGRLTAETLSRDVLRQTSRRVEQRVAHVLDGAVAHAGLARRLLERERVDPRDGDAVARYFAEVLEVTPSLSYLSFGREDDGAYCHAYRDRDGALSVRLRRPDGSGAATLADHRVAGGELELVGRRPAPPGSDPRRRPYYRAAARAGADTWTETYVFIGEDESLDVPGVTRAAPVRAPDGDLAGVVSADFELLALSRFLGRLHIGDTGAAFLIEYRDDGSRRVIAHPRPQLIVPDGDSEPIEIDAIADPRVRALAGRIPARLAELPVDEMMPVTLSADGNGYLGGFRRLGDHDLPWGIAVVVPADEVMGRVAKSRRDTLKAAVIACIAALIVATWLASRMARSLSSLARETEAIGRLEFEPRPRVDSALVEIDRLGAALEEMKAGLRSFHKFVPEDLVRAILRSGEEADLGGDRRTVTVLFSDIAGFTPIAESLAADELVSLLGEYLGAMTDEIHAERGTVDKYVGDAIMAFWNAPEPVEGHARAAAAAALRCRDRLAALRDHWIARGWPPVRARVGINTGEVVVGNFGSEQRFDYTIIGDPVNLASRLELLNKVYGTEILVSEDTRTQLGDDFVVRALDRVSVRGKERGVRVLELVGRTGEVADDELEHIRAYENALGHYMSRAFRDAADAFASVATRWPDDVAARVMSERARELAASPPPDDWDGVHRMTSK